MKSRLVSASLALAAASTFLAGCTDVLGSHSIATLQLPPTAAMTPGTTRRLPLVALDEDSAAAGTQGVIWSSSNTTVAEVSEAGRITARALGGATISARIRQVSAHAQLWVVPPAILACESNTATLCANWTFNGSTYDAAWQQGSRAVVTVERFGPDSVRFSRVDPSGTSQGMRAVYRGVIQNRSVRNGVVTWTENNFSFSGTWYADW